MVRRRERPYKKIVLWVLYAVAGPIALFLFINGIVHLISYIPPINTPPEKQVVEPVGERASVTGISGLLSDKGIIIDEIYQSSRSATIIASVKDGPQVYFSTTKGAPFQVNSLQLILDKLTIDNEKPILIDLRSDRPIVKF